MKEKIFNPISAWLVLPILFAIPLSLLFYHPVLWIIIAMLIFIFTLAGFIVINPNYSKVLVLFGKYIGTIKKEGFFWANPFYLKKSVSLRANNFDSDRMKVNDKRGNPIQISVILVWKIKDTFAASFEVDELYNFVKVQTDAAVRKLANHYAYDHVDNVEELTLRSSTLEVNESLEHELQERLNIAGIEVIEARIGYLAYAPEIAAAMLKRQQAEAIVSARYKIVEGAIGMVDGALKQLKERGIVNFDDKDKVKVVSNLLVVLCSDKETSPVLEVTN